jgi:hypothetical protein
MTGLRRLRILDSSRHNPAVGNLYGRKPLGKLLIVGLSHYGSESEVKGAGFTQAVVGAVIGGKRIPYFTKIARLFSDSNGHPYLPCDFYPLVAFYNFLPYVFRVRQRVEEDQWLNPDAQPFFFRVIDYVQPHRVLITGEQLWRALPSRLPERKERGEYARMEPAFTFRSAAMTGNAVGTALKVLKTAWSAQLPIPLHRSST